MQNKYQVFYNQTVAQCKKCDPKGFILRGRSYIACSCHVEYTRLKALYDTGLPRSYWNSVPTDFQGDQDSFEKVQSYIKNIKSNIAQGVGLYLHGKPGVGKTLMASYVIKSALKEGKNVKFYFFTDVLNIFTESWKDEAARTEVQENIIKSDILILDDVGKEYKSNAKLHESILDSVLRNRVSSLRPIIITSNFDMLDIKETYGAGIVDLFKETLNIIEVKGSSYRSAKLDEKRKSTDEST